MSSIHQMDNARRAEQCGYILKALKGDYGQVMTSVRSLSGALDLLGAAISVEEMQFRLSLLADSGYIRIWRAEETPAWRPDRMHDVSPHVIVFARLTPRGLHLIDGQIAPDPSVVF
jgi:hypothetical protein